MDIAQHLQQLEKSLLTREVRQDATLLTSLLSEDFREFGGSGRAFTRAEIILDLAAEMPGEMLRLEDFKIAMLAEGVALVTYRTEKEDAGNPASSLRSSIWLAGEGAWRICFHQGTRIPNP